MDTRGRWRLHVDVDIDGEWWARHFLRNVRGTWEPSGRVRYIRAARHQQTAPTTRQQRRGSIEPHRERLAEMLRQILDLDMKWDRSEEIWFRELVRGTGLGKPRSRRGRPSRIDVDAVAQMREEDGLTVEEIAKRLGFAPRSVHNALARVRRRREELSDEPKT